MYIYRVEDPITGRGPYNPDKNATDEMHLLDDDISDAHTDSAHPVMFGDCGFENAFRYCDDACKYYAGCVAVEQLYSWFIGFWNRLRDCGYIVRVYDVCDSLVHTGGYQCCFVMSGANIADEMSIDDFVSIVG